MTYEQVSSASSAKSSLNISSTVGREVVVSLTTALGRHCPRSAEVGRAAHKGPVKGIYKDLRRCISQISSCLVLLVGSAIEGGEMPQP
jgi:hypothetical protein